MAGETTFFFDCDDAALSAWRDFSPDAEPERLIVGEDYWIALSFARLRDAGLPVRLDNRLPDTGIVVFYAGHKRAVWRQHDRGNRALLVAVRSDRRPVGFADAEIVQNAASADGRRSFHIPHWPQPGLRPRDPARGTALRTLLFPGTPPNLHPDFASPRWRDFLAGRGIAFRQQDGAQPAAWPDYRDVDALLAIRPSGPELVRNKPAWKLFNAWLAGVPAILGPESGYRELREDPLDYLEADGLEGAITAVERLCDPAVFSAMVEQGRRRGAAFTTAATVERWQALLEGALPAPGGDRRRPLPRWRRQVGEAHARLRRLRSPADS
jgi:hypothetical protein